MSSFGLKNTIFAYFGNPSPRIATCEVVGSATGKTFVKLVTGGKDQKPNVSTCGAGEAAYGVLDGDAITGQKRSVWLGPEGLSVTAGAALTAGTAVQSDIVGKAIPHTTGVKLGTCVADTAIGADAHIELSL